MPSMDSGTAPVPASVPPTHALRLCHLLSGTCTFCHVNACSCPAIIEAAHGSPPLHQAAALHQSVTVAGSTATAAHEAVDRLRLALTRCDHLEAFLGHVCCMSSDPAPAPAGEQASALLYKTIEQPSAVFSAYAVPSTSGRVLVNRQTLLEEYESSSDGLATDSSRQWQFAEPLAAAVPIDGDHALTVAQNGTCWVVQLGGNAPSPAVVCQAQLGIPSSWPGSHPTPHLHGLVLSAPITSNSDRCSSGASSSSSSGSLARLVFVASRYHDTLHLLVLGRNGVLSLTATALPTSKRLLSTSLPCKYAQQVTS